MPVFALITHISCCLNWLIVYLLGNLPPKSCNWQLRVFWRLLVASSRTSDCHRSLHQHVATFLVTFCCTALKKQLNVCEQAYNLVFLRLKKKSFIFLSSVSHRREHNLYLSASSITNYFPPPIFSADSVEYWSLAVTTTLCVIAAGSQVLCIEGAPEQHKPSLKMHQMSGWELMSLDSLALCLECSTSDFVKYFLWNNRGHNFSVILLKPRKECAKTNLSKDAVPVSSSSAHTEEHYQDWEQGSHHPAGFSWRFFHAIGRNYVVSLCLTASTHTLT